MKRYFVFQFACFGDCLLATTVAKQLKQDEPGSHVTWAIARMYSSILAENPHVDEVMLLDVDPKHATVDEFRALDERIERIAASGEYDQVFHLQVLGRHLGSFCTTLRRTVFNVFGRPITVDISPVMRLTEAEKQRVCAFAEKHHLASYEHVVLFECSPASGQSTVNLQWGLQVASGIIAANPAACVILSGPGPISSGSPRIVGANVLSFRENAELSRYCTVFIGCSSGLTWLCTSEAARKLPMIQLLKRDSEIFAGVKFDFHVNGLASDHILEMVDFSAETVVDCVSQVLREGFASACDAFAQEYRPTQTDLLNNLRRLAQTGASLTELSSFARRFVAENRRYGNFVPIGRWQQAALALGSYARAAKYFAKARLKVKLNSWR